jgi:hypothetical protein
MAQNLSRGQYDFVAVFFRAVLSDIAQWTEGLADAAINDG